MRKRGKPIYSTIALDFFLIFTRRENRKLHRAYFDRRERGTSESNFLSQLRRK